MDADEELDAKPLSEAAVSTAGRPLSVRLRERLIRALQELSECRNLLAGHQIPYDSSFSVELEDHADVLEVETEEVEAPAPVLLEAVSSAPAAAVALGKEEELEKLKTEHDRELEEVRRRLRQSEAELNILKVQALTPKEPGRHQAGADASEARTPGSEEAAPSAEEAAANATHTKPRESDNEHEREKERLEVELSMAKALLMLNNVTMNIDLDEDRGVSSSAAEVVSLKGSRPLIQLLLTLKQKVSLLHQQYLLLRGDVLYMNHEMAVCRHWIFQSFRMAMQQQSQEHNSLQSRFERLSKVLN